MIEIIPYSTEYDPFLEAAAPGKLREMRTHGDVLQDSVRAAVLDGRCLGFGYLIADEDFRRAAEAEACRAAEAEERAKAEAEDCPADGCPECHLSLEFQALPDAGEMEPEVCAELLASLLDFFDALRESMPDRKPILRTWCGAGKTAYMDFLMSYGFSAARPMLVYTRALTEEDRFPALGAHELNQTEPEKTSNRCCVLTKIHETKLENTDEFSAFLSTMERAFETPESAENLRYRLADPGTRVFAAYEGERIIGGMVTWKTGACAASTEYIFCDPDRQRSGVAERLVRFAFAALRATGVTHVLLTVYGENIGAVSLYQKLGYELKSVLIEMQYT